MNIELGKTYETRSGRSVRIVCVDRKAVHQPIIGVLSHSCGDDQVETFATNGAYLLTRESENDLVREHIPVTYRWANVYDPDVIPVIGVAWDQEEAAKGQARKGRIGQIKLAFDPSGNLIVDKCEISAVEKGK